LNAGTYFMIAERAFDVLSTCFLLESHSRASLLKRTLLISWFDDIWAVGVKLVGGREDSV